MGYKVGLLHSHFSPILSGQERRIHMLLHEYVQQGHSVFVCAPTDGIDDAQTWESAGLRVIRHPTISLSKPLSIIEPVIYERRLAKFLAAAVAPEPDIALCFQYSYAAAAKRAWPHARVAFLCGSAQLDWATSIHGHRGWAARPLVLLKAPVMLYVERQAISLVDRVFVEGTFLKERLLTFHRGNDAKISLIPTPVDVTRFRPGLTSGEALRQECGVRDGTLLIVAVGRLDANKNYPILIRAMTRLRGSNWHLAIAGQGRDEAALRGLIAHYSLSNRVTLLGHRSNVETIYSAADIFVHPTLLDSYGNAVLEAMACGLPCVVSNGPKVGIARDLEDGVGVLLADPIDAGAWAEALQRLLSDPLLRQRLGAAARQFCERQPKWPEVARKVIEVLEIQEHNTVSFSHPTNSGKG
jgi:glycosyltransferase involved in cell wall biosynthesis